MVHRLFCKCEAIIKAPFGALARYQPKFDKTQIYFFNKCTSSVYLLLHIGLSLFIRFRLPHGPLYPFTHQLKRSAHATEPPKKAERVEAVCKKKADRR